MTTLETLKAARKLIEDESRWCSDPGFRGVRTVNGIKQRCMGAAIADAGAPWPSRTEVWKAVEKATRGDIPTFNDSHTHDEVLRAFDEAIARLEKFND